MIHHAPNPPLGGTRLTIALLGLVGAIACMSAGPQQCGSIEGLVVNQDGRLLPGVTISLSRESSIQPWQVTTTSLEGRYRFPCVPGGRYRVTAALSGQASPAPLPVAVAVAREAKLDLVFSIAKAPDVTISTDQEGFIVVPTTVTPLPRPPLPRPTP